MSVDIEWVGDPPLLDDVTKLRIQMGELPSMSAAVIRAAESQRLVPIPGVTIRKVDPEFFGTSRPYVWGPEANEEGKFVVSVDDPDVDRILGSDSSHQFRRVGDEGVRVITPSSHFALVGEIEGTSLKDIYQ
jgi:hypothetical protein